ncbi:polyketide synthase [Massarina eburnea CBS 473.64]|uniref:Polyketide synthase n=1 Tax=Massarina eburnea CBS 473.64 TaxID=1395130 RepID=A0A6A6S7T3_9PLEO|nr:polyketide synthase [Massarina eburnea CBS 473.64]
MGNEPIAIVGSSCRLPGGATTPSRLWDLLCTPRDLSQTVPDDRFNADRFYHPDPEYHGTANVKKAYFLEEHPARFDAAFFNINPREAEAIDPQQRMHLELVYEAIESAGLKMETMRGSNTGVFSGLMCADYYDIQMRDVMHLSQYHSTGTARSILSNRASYFFDWKGPSMTIDTACSSSLVAVHLAAQSLRNGECDVAVASGVNLIFGPEMFVGGANLHMLSPNGRSQMWDAGADGYARGEGGGVVVLKLLKDAMRDGDGIESIIRGSGVNSDARTPGITKPSSKSQAELMRRTFRRAGLDLDRVDDRCHYFEAHGTGTQAGDAVEAEAISDVFAPEPSRELYVGSIKTVVGHLEGAAGIAGLLKASLAVQHGRIPPNFYCKKLDLNPGIAPFYQGLHVPSATHRWPTLPDGLPRRACVNSFGFGGTNAHVILEECIQTTNNQTTSTSSDAIGPILLSAASLDSLHESIHQFGHYLQDSPSISLRDLAWTLSSRRSLHPFKVALAARTRTQLLEELEKSLNSTGSQQKPSDADENGTLRTLAVGGTPSGLLGVFTGQGAQWPRMGYVLLIQSAYFAETLRRLDAILQDIHNPPAWSLITELGQQASESKVNQADVSQTLCTAVQISLVDLLNYSGVVFDAVIGHSSGEIGAAYAAGCISARAAIQIAYRRGQVLMAPRVPNEKALSMMAVGLSAVDADNLCRQEQYLGRIFVAADNAPLSTTLSGEADALNQLKADLEKESKTARMLRIDQAYHSPFIAAHSPAYLSALENDGHTYNMPSDIIWVSSVHSFPMDESADPLDETYWCNNLANTVLFREAVEQVVREHGPFAGALEVGPHATLKAPVTQTVKRLTGAAIPYCGTLDRGKDDLLAFTKALAFLVTETQCSTIDQANFARVCAGSCFQPPRLLKNLPSYAWGHEKKFWRESRISKEYRLSSEPPNELLGVQTSLPDGQIQWRNILRSDKIPWLSGHKVQHEILFPAAGYCAMALEAIAALTQGKDVKLVEMEDVRIESPLTFDDDSKGLEIVFTLRKTVQCLQSTRRDLDTVFAEYTCVAGKAGGSEPLRVKSTGRLSIHLGPVSEDTLPKNDSYGSKLQPVSTEEFYHDLSSIELDYTGDFKAITSIERQRQYARTITSTPVGSYRQHPALLDAYFQSILAAYFAPGDGSMNCPFLPQSIERIRFNPILWSTGLRPVSTDVRVSSYITDITTAREGAAPTITGDVEASRTGSLFSEVQVEGLKMVALSRGPPDERPLFAHMEWLPCIESGIAIDESEEDTVETRSLIEVCDRISVYHYRRLRDMFVGQKLPDNHRPLFTFIDHLLPIVESGQHPTAKSEWIFDDEDTILHLAAPYKDQIDVRLINAVAENIVEVVKGTTTMLEHMLADSVLDRFYKEGTGLQRANYAAACGVRQMAHRYPGMKILEIGGGTGSTTKSALNALGDAFSSYTFTDISSGFFQNAQRVFQDWSNKMEFRTLDIEQDPSTQGFATGTYDLIIASNVLHATRCLEETMRNVRKLLKPGGYLAMVEITGEVLRIGFMMCGLPGWWLGKEDGRPFAPVISRSRWDNILKSTGFSGVDAIHSDFQDKSKHAYSAIISQATDASFGKLRAPLSSSPVLATTEQILVIGGTTPSTKELVEEIQHSLSDSLGSISFQESIEGVHRSEIKLPPNVLILSELDDPFCREMDEAKLQALQDIAQDTRIVLWVTRDRMGSNPHSNMLVGLARCIVAEMPELHWQILDFGPKDQVSSEHILESFLRLIRASAEGNKEDMLWTIEPELAVKRGEYWIPRILPVDDMNARLATSQYGPSRPQFRNAKSASSDRKDGMLHIAISSFSSYAIKVQSGCFLYVVTGYDQESSERVIAFSQSCSDPFVTLPKSWTFPIPPDIPDNERLLQGVLQYLTVRNIVAIPAMRKAAVLTNDLNFIDTLQESPLLQGVDVLFASHISSQEARASPYLYVHPHATKRQLLGTLPSDLNTFIDLTGFDSRDSRLSRLIAKGWSGSCTQFHTDDFFSSDSSFSQNPPSIHAQQLFTEMFANRQILTAFPHMTIQAKHSWLAIEHKTESDSEVRMRLSMHDRPLLQGDRTYILIGLTGQIGQSLCRWMVDNGARHIVTISRTPPTDDSWCKEIVHRGARVATRAADVCNKDRLQEVVRDIRSTFPPIAGVANAAMVLSDVTFSRMTLEEFQKVTAPKVLGSQNLHELFEGEELAFFIMFSSLACVVGNVGQSNYAAANMFMVALAAQRRSSGLAASVIDTGMIIGLGHMATRATSDQIKALEERYNYMRISETELHAMFSEAIVAGYPDSEYRSELITGLQRASDAKRPVWSDNPIFCHHREQSKIMEGAPNTNSSESIPVRQRISEAYHEKEAFDILQTCFLDQLAQTLQLSPASISTSQALIELGVDSLMAVEIWSWLFKETGYNVSVLKILSGLSANDVCRETINSLLGPRKADNQNAFVESNGTAQSGSTPPRSEVGTLGETTISEGDSMRDHVLSKDQGDSLINLSFSDCPATNDFQSKSVTQELERQGPISYRQSRLWYVMACLDDPTTFNCTWRYEISGPVVTSRFEKAVVSALQRHESLRTALFTDPISGDAIQGVLSSPRHVWHHSHITDEVESVNAFEKLQQHTYDLSTGKSVVFALYSLSETRHFLLIGYHHIVLDGFGLQLVLRDIDAFYKSENIPSHPKAQYIDFTSYERRINSQDVSFWKTQLENPPQPLPLFPFAKRGYRIALPCPSMHSYEVVIPSEIAQVLRKTCMNLGVTGLHFHLAVLQVMLSHLSQTNEMCIGMGDSSRFNEEFSGVVGFMVNILPLRFKVEPDQTFASIAKNSKTTALGALEHSGLSLDRIMAELNVARDSTQTTLFQVIVNYVSGVTRSVPVGDCSLSFKNSVEARHPQDLVLTIRDEPDRSLILNFGLQTDLYSAGHARLFGEMYTNLMNQFAAIPDTSIGKVDIVPQTIRENGQQIGKGPVISAGFDGTLTGLINEISTRNSSQRAAKDETGEYVTYGQLQEKTWSFAGYLHNIGVSKRSRICVLAEPSINAVCIILAIWHLGAVYVPLDFANPPERNRLIAHNCNATTLIIDGQETTQTASLSLEYVVDVSSIHLKEYETPPDQSNLEDDAVLLYTSGSTGVPKGVRLTQGNLKTQVVAVHHKFKLDHPIVLQQSALRFDASLFQILVALTTGGTLIMSSARKDPAAITTLMVEEKINVTLAVPSEYLMWFQYGFDALAKCIDWRVAFCGGEAMTHNVIRAFSSLENDALELINAYGPSEAAVACSMSTVDYRDHELQSSNFAIPVGSALPNYEVFVADQSLSPLPVGWTGEICICGPAVALGYFESDAQTEYSFPKPHVPSDDTTVVSKRMFRTGDKGRIDDNGAITILGRLEGDSQVKLRGQRVELSDISNTIVQFSNGAVQNCVVVMKNTQEPFLVAFVVLVAASKADYNTPILQELLATLPLPSYMRPALAISIDSIPMTSSGKMDLRTLHAIELPRDEARASESIPLNSTEQTLKELWEDTIGETSKSFSISKSSDFFAVGGDSIRLLKLLEKMKREVNSSLTLQALIEHSSLEKMSALVEKKDSPLRTTDEIGIDWEIETTLPTIHHITPLPSQQSPEGKEGLVVLLTGSTGFLGHAILDKLLPSHHISEIHCVAVRATQKLEPFTNNEKVHVHRGDLAAPFLGLSSHVFDKLRDTVDIILHNGASVSFLQSFRSLAPANVWSTKVLIELATPRHIPIHYISTAGVGQLSNLDSIPEISMASYPPPTTGNADGYTASKWASEVLLEKASAILHVPTTIYRPTSIVGPGAPAHDVVRNIFHYSKLLNAAPVFPHLHGWFDLVPVDFVAERVAQDVVALHSETAGHAEQKGGRFVHIAGRQRVPVGDLRDVISEEAERGIGEIDVGLWVEEARSGGMDDGLARWFVDVLGSSREIRLPWIETGSDG